MKMNIVISTFLKLTHEIKDWFCIRPQYYNSHRRKSLCCSGPTYRTERLFMPVMNKTHDRRKIQ